MPDAFIRVRGVERVEQRLRQFAGSDFLVRYHERVATRILRWVVANFEAAGTERSWAPLKPSTVYARRQSSKGGGVQPLRSGGAGSQMISTLNKRADAHEAVVGFGSPIAVFHQFGTHGPYTIAPRFKQALSFPSLWTREYAVRRIGRAHATALTRRIGGQVITRSRPAFASRHPAGFVRRAWLTPLQGQRPGAFSRMTTFQQRGRSRKDFSTLNFMTVKSVRHPGLPARPMLPSPGMARQLAMEVALNMVREQLGG